MLEEGDTTFPLQERAYELQIRASRLYIEAFAETRVLSRRIISVDQQRPGILDCTVHRFGGAEGKLSFLDLDRPQTAHRQLSASRRSFGEQFRRMLRRQFPQWEIVTLSSSMDLRRSFSPVFPRATLKRGEHVIAALACPSSANEAEFLTFGLLWFEHVRSARTALYLFLPEGSGCLTAHRLNWLRNEVLHPRLFLFNEHGSAGEVDPQDLGNLETHVGSRYTEVKLSPELDSLLNRLTDLPHVSSVPELSGAVSLRLRGAEFARVEKGSVRLGLVERREISEAEFGAVETFARHLLDLPHTPSALERWLEGVVRSNLQVIDASLLPFPVHGQVLSFAGRDRGSVDLLAITSDGHLAVLELKAAEDLHLPMQALDYWMRIKWHAARQDLAHLYPATPLTSHPPKLILLAPALSFHSANATVLRYFSPEVEVERVGINSDWQTQFRVVMRLRGADTPTSHGRS